MIRKLVYVGLVVSTFVFLAAKPAAAFCSHKPTVYNTGTLTGIGPTCTDAQYSVEGNLFNTAEANCQAIYGEDGEVDSYTETLNSCEPNGTGKLMTGSAEYTCVVCHCVGFHCG